MGKAFSIKFDPQTLVDAIDNAGKACLQGTRKGAQAGAQVFYEEVLLRTPVGDREFHWFHGKQFKKTGKKYPFKKGDLKRSIYQAFSADNSHEYSGTWTLQGSEIYDKATYHISWRHMPGKKGEQNAPYGYMVEFGTSRAKATPFLRPAFDVKRKEVLDAMEATWRQDVNKAI